MRQSATRAVAKRPKPHRKKIKLASATRASPKKAHGTPSTKAKQIASKKAKRTSQSKVTRTSPKTKPTSVAAMQAQIDALRAELRGAQDRENASAEVLGVINSSSGDLAPVFEALLENALRLCKSAFGILWIYDGVLFRAAAIRGAPPQFTDFLRDPVRPAPGAALQRLIDGEAFVHYDDHASERPYLTKASPLSRATVDLGGARTGIVIALRKENRLLGAIRLYRQEVRPFTDKQIALLQNFAAQAVIAMENARLITQTREALEQQTATAEVLGVINSSPGDLTPVFDAMLERAMRLCEAAFGVLWMFDGERLDPTAWCGVPTEFAEFLSKTATVPGPGTAAYRFLKGGERSVIQTLDMADEAAYHAGDTFRVSLVDLGRARTALHVPLCKEDAVLGVITLYRQEVRLFTNKQIALLQNFAAQAVIAMENARLINETREALEQQTATAEVLGIINSSPGNLQPVFDTLIDKALQLCEASFGYLLTYDGERLHSAADRGHPAFAAWVRAQGPYKPEPGTTNARLIAGEDVVQIPDVTDDASLPGRSPIRRAVIEIGGFRTMLSLALRKENSLLGVIHIYRQVVRPFTEKQIALLQNFAAQAVIAIENARLLGDLRQRTTDLQESLEYQTATSDMLKVISRSTFDLQPVLDTVVETAARLCNAEMGMIATRQGDVYRAASTFAFTPEWTTAVKDITFEPGRGSVIGRVAQGRQTVQVEDLAADAEYAVPEVITIGKMRTAVGVPLLRDREPIGVLYLARQRAEAFEERQVALVRTFADQAVIAIENTRLITETREALEQQTATAEVLGVINSSPGDLTPVFRAMLEKALRLCGADLGNLLTYDGERFEAVVGIYGITGVGERELSRGRFRPWPGGPLERLVSGEHFTHSEDVRTEVTYQRNADFRELVDGGGYQSITHVALRKESQLLGAIVIFFKERRQLTDKQIALLQNFAAQAVIAMENARLLGELRGRTRDLQESLEYQTATSDVLQVISRSTFDLEPVLATVAETAARLCDCQMAFIFRRQEDGYHLAASVGFPPAVRTVVEAGPILPGRGTITGRAALTKSTVHIPDARADPEYTWSGFLAAGGTPTMLSVPLLRQGEPVGVITLGRDRVEPFSEKQIALVTTFADQAVIAIENARLLGELRDREAELRVTFDNMVDGVVMFDEELHLAAWNRNFQELLQLPGEFLAERHGFDDYIGYLTKRGEFGDTSPETQIERLRARIGDHYSFERTRPDGTVIEVRHNPMPGGGIVLIYSDITERKRSETEIRAARDTAESALRELQTAQASLVHAQKMAALGQLTAGIAHEIKNPLNFVNNFAGLSVELLDELKETATPVFAGLDDDKRAEIEDTVKLLTSNLEKIAEHGQRADGIVRSMLEHSRGGSGERREVDLNALVDEALNLAYHGARAQDQSFNITMEREFDADLAPIEVVPQDVTRVFLNLIGNGFYAAAKRSREAADGYRPVLRVSTRDLGNEIEIRVRDNGTGIAPEIRDKLFQPFVTTKPTGEGTGLGLSISYEVVAQQHGGSIEVDSEPGSYTEFTVRLPRRGNGRGAGNRA